VQSGRSGGSANDDHDVAFGIRGPEKQDIGAGKARRNRHQMLGQIGYQRRLSRPRRARAGDNQQEKQNSPGARPDHPCPIPML
jgi:hypothetical protein